MHIPLLSSADNFCKQFGPRSGPTECQSWSGFNMFDTLIVFLKEFLEKINFEKCQQTATKAWEITQHSESKLNCPQYVHSALKLYLLIILWLFIYFRLLYNLNPFQTNGMFHTATYKSGWSIAYIEGSQFIFPKNIEFLFLKINFVLANSADPDEMPHYAAFHLGLHCLWKYQARSF